jgi:hypothetical protein
LRHRSKRCRRRVDIDVALQRVNGMASFQPSVVGLQSAS